MFLIGGQVDKGLATITFLTNRLPTTTAALFVPLHISVPPSHPHQRPTSCSVEGLRPNKMKLQDNNSNNKKWRSSLPPICSIKWWRIAFVNVYPNWPKNPISMLLKWPALIAVSRNTWNFIPKLEQKCKNKTLSLQAHPFPDNNPIPVRSRNQWRVHQ